MSIFGKWLRRGPAGPVVEVNLPASTSLPQSPMPESSWRWRRIYTWTLTIVILVLMWRAVDRLADIAVVEPAVGIPAFVTVLKLLLIGQIIFGLNYLVGPTAEHIVQMVQVAKSLRENVVFSATAGKVMAGPAAAVVPAPAPVSEADIPPPDPDTPENAPWQR